MAIYPPVVCFNCEFYPKKGKIRFILFHLLALFIMNSAGQFILSSAEPELKQSFYLAIAFACQVFNSAVSFLAFTVLLLINVILMVSR